MDLIFSYTRAMALADGVLIDVTETAQEAGFRYPVAVTEALYNVLGAVPDSSLSSLDGRLWDLLWMGWLAVRRSKDDASSELLYEFLIDTATGREPELLKVRLVVGPGDAGEPVITIMLPHED